LSRVIRVEGGGLIKTLSEKSIAITGALGGIGIPVLRHLNSLGAQLFAIDLLPEENAHRLLASNDLASVNYTQLDITDEKAVSEFSQKVLTKQCPDSLVNLAAMVVSGDLINQKGSDLIKTFEVNVIGQILVSNAFVNNWIKNKVEGNIVFTSSWIDHVPWPSVTPYAASKAAVVAVARGYAMENAKYGVRANVISPGIVDVGMAAKQWREEPDYQRRASRAIPLGTLQTPQSVAGGIAFLLSDDAAYMTGSNLLMDGGASLYPQDPEGA
jgi:NAD(P)-dependent dehydrogenase (short-subunit alcohol dehydrogenase family)